MAFFLIARICYFLLLSGVIFGVFSGNMTNISQVLFSVPAEVVSLILKMGGSICLFCGLMGVAQSSGLVKRFSLLLARPIRFLIPQTKYDDKLRADVTMNVASNFFGLGNAATPYGIRASGRLVQKGFSRSLASFLILNTCSVQLIPTTVCALRQAHGASQPTDILPVVWCVQGVSCLFGLILTRFLFREE